MTDLEYIAANLSDEDILCQIAEEAAELAQAALKLRRVITGTNPTPVNKREAIENVIEEYGDVIMACEVLTTKYYEESEEVFRKLINGLREYKFKRWADRIKEGKKHD